MMEAVLFLALALCGPVDVADPVACIKTTIDASGRTSNNKVISSSGDRSNDRDALQFLRALDFSRVPIGVELGQTGHILVRATGSDTYTVDVTEARLLDSCPTAGPDGA